jgi:predicted nuclease of predicted toxin-antitoxin system
METPETQESGGKEVRGGRPPKMIVLTANLTITDMETLLRAGIKMMKQTGEDVPRDRLISEAIQLYAKSMIAQE